MSAGGGGRGGLKGEGGGVGAEEDQEEREGRHVQVPDNSQNSVPDNSPPELVPDNSQSLVPDISPSQLVPDYSPPKFGNNVDQSFLGRKTAGRRVTALATSSCLAINSPARSTP